MQQQSAQSLEALNLAQAWINSVLYFHRIYPAETFVKRTIYGTEVPITNSPPLEAYIKNFMKEIEAQIQSINYLEVCIVSKQKTLLN